MDKYQIICDTFFKDPYGQPFKITKGQSDIFRAIYEPDIKRASIKSITQYGKSETASMAILMSAVSRYEKILIVSPSEKQSAIIMNYVIGHIFDNSLLVSGLMIEEALDRLQRERSKKRLNWKNRSEIMILTANVREVNKEAQNLMGFGGTMVIMDEASLIPDSMQSKILRMVGTGGKLVKLGNPFYRNHFFRSFHDSRYLNITINKEQAIAEGRVSQEFVEEAKANMSEIEYKIFYEVEFPEAGAEDSLIPYEWIMNAVNRDVPVSEDDTKQSALDVARFGRDTSVYTLRQGAKMIHQKVFTQMDTMELSGKTAIELDSDDPEIMPVDIVGIGSGVFDRLDEMGYAVAPFNGGEKPTTSAEEGKFYNLRAECFWNLRELFRKEEISIPDDPELVKELSELRFRISSEKKIRMEDKEQMKKRIGRSPDKADSLAMAFFPMEVAGMEII